MDESVKKTYIRSGHNFDSEGARGIALWGNESRKGVLQNALVKIKK
jgi:hypothetical protein